MGALVAPKSMALTCRGEEPSTASQPGTASRQMNSFDAVLDALREILAARASGPAVLTRARKTMREKMSGPPLQGRIKADRSPAHEFQPSMIAGLVLT
jgi:hypothetical protein